MPGRLAQFAPGSYYHIYHRGNNRQLIFFQPENYDFFLARMRLYLDPAMDVLAFCLMPTHYHLLVRVRENVVSKAVSHAMMRLLTSYTKAINRRFDRVGHLFQGPFGAKWITEQEYLLQVCVYIHANPVRAGLVYHPEDWEYSNYRSWIQRKFTSQAEAQFFRQNFHTAGAYADLVGQDPWGLKTPEVL